MKNNIFFTIVLFIFLFGCEKELNVDMPEIEQEIVVDGWIENDRFPCVILTKSMSYVSKVDSSSYLDFVMTRAKVIVSDGENEEILTLIRDNNYVPAHLYRGTELKGVEGKTYTLDIYLSNKHYSSTAIIPKVTKPDTIWFEQDAEKDSTGFIWMKLTDDGNADNYYRIFTRTLNKEEVFTPTHLSTINDRFFNGKTMSAPIYKGSRGILESESDFRFKIDDTIIVKLSSITKESFTFWQNYEYEVMNSGNPFGASSSNLSTNINGGLGIWCGYGSNYSVVITKKQH